MHLTPNPISQLKERLKKRNQQRMDARKQRQKEVCYTLRILLQTRIGVGGPLQLWELDSFPRHDIITRKTHSPPYHYH